MRRAHRTTVTALAVLTGLAASASFASAGPNPIQQVSTGNPVTGCHAGEANGVNFPNAETEPMVSVDPNHSRHAVVTWQQDRFSNGGAHAGGYAWSSDGNHYNVGVLPFGQCSGANDFERVSDLWVSFGGDGTAYASGLEFDTSTPRSSVGGATSFDGGATWRFSQAFQNDNDPAALNDKNSVTGDLLHPGVAYQVWDRLYVQPSLASSNPTSIQGPALISITRDHGRTWSPAKTMVDTSVKPNQQTIGNIIVEDPRTGRLYDFYNLITYTDTAPNNPVDAHYAMSVSDDQGATWSKPTAVTPDTSVAEVDPNDPTKVLRAGGGLESVAIDPVSGELYLAYEGSDFSGGAFDQAQVVSSTDHGATWSAPALVSAPGVPAFTPVIAVDHQNTVNVSYYDLRFLQPGNTTTLPTARFEKAFRCGDLAHGTEQQITPTFDWLQAPLTGTGYMLGDYEGMSPAGTFGVQSVFVATLNAPGDPSDVYSGRFHGPFGGASGGHTFSGARAAQHERTRPMTAR